jgi:hypothetical protein
MAGSDIISDAVVGGSASGELGDAANASKRNKKNRETAFPPPTEAGICSNCNTALKGPVCHSCGQVADTFHRPVWELLMEVLDGLLGFEGRFWRTLPPLMLKPGKITHQYLSGVRARYVQPFRLYLTASVAFFLIFFALDPNSGELFQADAEDAQAAMEEVAEAVSDIATDERIAELEAQLARAGIPEEERERALEATDNTLEALSEGEIPIPAFAEDWKPGAIAGVRRALLPEDHPEDGDVEAVQLGDAGTGGPNASLTFNDVEDLPYDFRVFLADQAEKIITDNGASLVEELKRWLPRMMFLMLPLYALILGLTHFYKRGYFFYDHLVVSLHFHAFIFFMFMVLMAVSTAIGMGPSMLLFFIWSNYYLYRIHRSVYHHGRFSSFLRTIFMDFVYLILLSMGMAVLMLIGVALA